MESLVKRQAGQIEWSKLSTDLKVERGLQPAAGFASEEKSHSHEATFLASIAAARQEAQALFELSQDLGASLSLGETLSVFSVKLKRLVPYDSIAIYIRRDDQLIPEHGCHYAAISPLKKRFNIGSSERETFACCGQHPGRLWQNRSSRLAQISTTNAG